MSTDNDKIIERIRKLLNLGENDAAALGEAENALRFARRLMLQHNITEGELDRAKDVHESAADAENVEYGHTGVYTTTRHLTAWENSLIWAIGELIGTVQWYKENAQSRKSDAGTVVFNKRTGKPELATRIVFYGPAEDCADAAELVTEWTLTVTAMARLRYGSALVREGRNYAEGFCSALYRKMQDITIEERKAVKALENKARESLPGDTVTHAIVVRNAHQLMVAKKERGKEYLQKSMGIKLRKGRSGYGRGYRDDDAYSAGRADGRKANLSRERKKKLT
jgi:hypothetical protein